MESTTKYKEMTDKEKLEQIADIVNHLQYMTSGTVIEKALSYDLKLIEHYATTPHIFY